MKLSRVGITRPGLTEQPNWFRSAPRLTTCRYQLSLCQVLTSLFFDMSLQGLISGAECAAPANPLSQVLKHTEGDRSVQQVRIVLTLSLHT